MNSSAKEFLSAAIADYNALFKTNFSVDSNGFQNYYRDLAKRVKEQDVDLLIVVGMFLTGFDAPTLNTLFVDRRYITTSLKREYASENGTELNAVLPKMSPLNPQFLTRKQTVFQKIAAFVEKFKGVGGKV